MARLFEIEFRFDTRAAQKHVAREVTEAYDRKEGMRILQLHTRKWYYTSGDMAETIADAINGGPVGGRWREGGDE